MKDERNVGLRCCSLWPVLFSETVFLWIGPLFRRLRPPVSPERTFSKTNAPILTKHPVHLLPEKWYTDQGATVLTDVETDEFGIARGTKQGDHTVKVGKESAWFLSV